MASPNSYKTGKVTVTSGSLTVSGTGTMWLGGSILPGDILSVAGLTVSIDRLTSNGQLVLAFPWPGSTLTNVDYEIRYTPEATRVLTDSREALRKIAEGEVISLQDIEVRTGAAGSAVTYSAGILTIPRGNRGAINLGELTMATGAPGTEVTYIAASNTLRIPRGADGSVSAAQLAAETNARTSAVSSLESASNVGDMLKLNISGTADALIGTMIPSQQHIQDNAGTLVLFMPTASNTADDPSLTLKRNASDAGVTRRLTRSNGSILGARSLQIGVPYIGRISGTAPNETIRLLAAFTVQDVPGISQAIDNVAVASEAIVQTRSGDPLLALDAGGNPMARFFRETGGTGDPAETSPIAIEAGGFAIAHSSARGLLVNLAPESIDTKVIEAPFSGPWSIRNARYSAARRRASVDWLGVPVELEIGPHGRPVAADPRKIYAIIGVGQSDQGLGGTGSWVIDGLAPHAAFMVNNAFNNKLRGSATGFGDAVTSGHGTYTSYGLTPFLNPGGQQSVIDATAARLSHLQSKLAGRSDWYVTANVSAGGASMGQISPMPPNGETIWNNTLHVLDEIKRLGDFYGLPVEILAFDFRQGYADRDVMDTATYLARLTSYEQGLASAVASRFPAQTYRPYFVLQQVVDAIRSLPDDGEGPALAQLLFARANSAGNVLHVPSTAMEKHEVTNIHATEWAYVANGESSALAIFAAHFGGTGKSSPWPVTDVGVLTGTTFTYQISGTRPQAIERANIGAAFKVVSANAVTVTDARLIHRGMDGARHVYDVVLTLSGAPGAISYITHCKPDEAVYLTGVAAIRSADPLDLVFATPMFDRSRVGPYATHVPGDENIPVPTAIWDWAPYHKIGV